MAGVGGQRCTAKGASPAHIPNIARAMPNATANATAALLIASAAVNFSVFATAPTATQPMAPKTDMPNGTAGIPQTTLHAPPRFLAASPSSLRAHSSHLLTGRDLDTRPILSRQATIALLALPLVLESTHSSTSGDSFLDAVGGAHAHMQSLLADGKLSRVGRVGDWALRKLGASLGRPLNATLLDAFEPTRLAQGGVLLSAVAGQPADGGNAGLFQIIGQAAVLLLLMYLLFVPYLRFCPTTWILVFTLLFGWTGIGWVLLLLYSMMMC